MDAITVGYATDVEGNLNFWNRYINHSEILIRNEAGVLVLKDNCHFVYGGDSCDRGYGDLTILRELITLKKTYPTRVHLLMGNRDINKLRFSVAVLPEVLKLEPKCYFASPAAIVDKNPDYKYNDHVSKVKWILLHTMGSPYAFEYRREELRRAGCCSDDAAVAKSFVSMVAVHEKDGPGLMLQYLTLAQVVVVLGDVMFVHGALHDFNIGFVPYNQNSPEATAAINTHTTTTTSFTNSLESHGYIVNDPHTWCREINAFAAAEIQDYKENIVHYTVELEKEISVRRQSGEVGIGSALLFDEISGYCHPQPGSRLLTYGMGDMANGNSTRSVIYSSYLQGGRPNPCSTAVTSWLQCITNTDATDSSISCSSANIPATGGDSGRVDYIGRVPIRRLVVGHQPCADAPLVLNLEALQVISVDSSYSANTQWNPYYLAAALAHPVNTATDSAATGCTTSSSGSVGAVKKQQFSAAASTGTIPEESWVTYANYYSTQSMHCTSGDVEDIPNIPTAVAQTRAPLCVTELLFNLHLQGLATTTCRVHGVLSEGSKYSCTLPTTTTTTTTTSSAVVDTVPVEQDITAYIGKETPDGWYVKAVGVKSVVHTELQALLAHSAGYNFRNKLVSYDELKAIFTV